MAQDWLTFVRRVPGYDKLGHATKDRGVYKYSFAAVIVIALFCITYTYVFGGSRAHHHAHYMEYVLGAHWHGWPSTQQMIVFGDSWSAINFDITGPSPTAAHPEGGYIETIGNGWNWALYLTQNLNESSMLMANFAIGGAPLVNFEHNDPRSMEHQVHHDFTYFNNKTGGFWAPNTSLFGLWIGINDLHGATETPLHFPSVMDMYALLLQHLYDAGARNFMVLNSPPMSRSPLARAGTRANVWSELVADWNTQLSKLVWAFAANQTDTTMLLFDAWTLLNDVMDDPCVQDTSCGLLVTDAYCPMYSAGAYFNVSRDTSMPECPHSVNKYFWLDPLHPTTIVQETIARSVHKALKSSGPKT